MSTELATRPITIPAELKSLPIFQVIGNQVKQQTQKLSNPNSLVAKIVFWGGLVGVALLFFKYLPSLIMFASQTLLLIAMSILIIVLLLLYPKIISLIYNAGSMILFKGEKSIIRNNPIETLQILQEDANQTLRKVKSKIASVDGVKLDMISSSENSKREAEVKYNQVKSLTEIAAKMDEEAKSLAKDGNKEKARSKEREANETRLSANLRMQEGKASEENAKVYAQYANQFAKVFEILKDNESAAKIYVNALSSSISIISKKLEATDKMKSATEGLSDVFNIKESWRFKEAMDAASSAISNNIANIRSNIDFLDGNKGAVLGIKASQSELEEFVKQIDSGRLKSLNVSEVSDASYDLKPEEMADPSFKLID
ncbi:MAG: hypothetical protein ACK5UE_04220 [Chitinophagales bacterium]|jgi:hypothetical protein|nr:hypothetical protein [Sphingobacteriales bacterium]